MKTFFKSLLAAVPLVLVVAGLSFGQTEATATWSLTSTDTVSAAVAGNVTAMPESMLGLQAAYEVPPAGTTSSVQKLKPDSTTSGTGGTGSWPVETAPNAGRYVEFTITPQTNFSVIVNSISMMLGAKGMKGINASVFYSDSSDFADSTKLAEVDSLIENAVADTTFSGLNLIVNSGVTLYVRVYPWTSDSSTSTTKYAYVGDVVLSGTANNPMLSTTGIWSFQSDTIGEALGVRDWGPGNAAAVVAKDTITPSATNHVLEFFNNNYNSAAVLEAVLPSGKTMADYSSFNFKGFFAQGDVGYKIIYVQAFTKMPGSGFENGGDTVNNIGSYNRAVATGSTNWENISIPIIGSSSMSDTVYLAFGFNGAGTGNIGGTSVPTIWYADSVQLVSKPVSPGLATSVTRWGIAGYNNPGWQLNVTGSGDSANFHGGPVASWAAVRGAFTTPLVGNTTTDGAIVVTGQVTFVGEAPDVGSGLRYGIYNNLVPGTLNTSVADSAYWSGLSTSSYGYTISPQSGTDELPASYSFGGAGAAQWIVMGGNWLSSYGGAIGFGPYVVEQAPIRAKMNPGTYDFAFSVHPQSNGTKLVNFYLIQKNSSGQIVYWDGASLTDTTSQMRSDTLNAIIFGAAGGPQMTGMIFTDVHDSLGPDITIPPAPFSPFYVDQWGMYPNGANNGGWHFQVDPDTIIGNAGIAGTASPTGGWAMIRGGFESPVTATAESAIVVTGQITFNGPGPTPWSALRYGLFMNDSAGTLKYPVTDSATWSGIANYSYGYMFTPQSGTDYVGNIPGGTGASQDAATGGTWYSTYGGAIGLDGLIPQQPPNANFTAGTYNWGISVQPMPDGSNQVRFYMETDSSKILYWYGGTITDPSRTTDAFNGVCFGLDPETYSSPITSMILTNVEVNKGTPFTVPKAPWSNYYIATNSWGFYGGRLGGWSLTSPITGNANIGGAALTGPVAVRAGFYSPVSPINSKDSTLVITGDIQFVGGGFQTGDFRFGLYSSGNPGTVKLDSAEDSSGVWSGTDSLNSGYLFIPESGPNGPLTWYGHTAGSWGGIVNGVWDSTSSGYVLGDGVLKPANAAAGSGTYSFEISVAPVSNGSQQVGFELVNSADSSKYAFGQTAVDDHSPLASQFNSVIFGLASGTGATAMNISNVQVTMAPSPTVTAIKEATNSELPTKFDLSQNYPNPFNPSTVIQYQVPKASNVVIKVYNAIGQNVATLINERQNPGNYSVTFNGDRFASGVYFVRMVAGSFVKTDKMLLLK